MPILLNSNQSEYYLPAHQPCPPAEAGSIDIGLINNMPDGALQNTERQFLALLAEAAGDAVVRLWLYTLPGVRRSDSIRRHIDACYSPFESLWDSRLDGLIVTGAEPRAAKLQDEPCWEKLTKVIDWADRNTLSSVWSCLAAHAAILHFDGIDRRPLSDKRSGVFECVQLSDHPLTYGLPRRFRIPHSRWNDISEEELTSCGYRVLTRADHAGVDMFVKHRNSSFVFFQGHPEYGTNTLLREYRRDIGRYLSRELDTHPEMPQGYFAADTVELLMARERALSSRHEALLGDFPTTLIEGRLVNTWRSGAVQLYANWLAYICRQKERRAQMIRPEPQGCAQLKFTDSSMLPLPLYLAT
jgi:homoserine O-succinyltransferase